MGGARILPDVCVYVAAQRDSRWVLVAAQDTTVEFSPCASRAQGGNAESYPPDKLGAYPNGQQRCINIETVYLSMSSPYISIASASTETPRTVKLLTSVAVLTCLLSICTFVMQIITLIHLKT